LELAALYADAGALVFPSLHEGFGIPLVESMYFGLPIIAGDVYSIPEICADACCYVNPRKPIDLADAFREVSADPKYAADLAKKSRSRLRLFNLLPEVERLASELYYTAFPEQKWFSSMFPSDEIDRIVLPTPVGKDRWKIDITAKNDPPARFSVFVGTNPFGSFMTQYYPQGISFFCYPDGMALTIVLCGSESDGKPVEDIIDHIVCRDNNGESIVLFDKHENQCHHTLF